MSRQHREFIDSREAYSSEEIAGYNATADDYAEYGQWLGSYERSCQEFALCGDPAREAADYEENARYDYYNELREEFYDNAELYADQHDNITADDINRLFQEASRLRN